MYTVELTYFKQSGKCYTGETYSTDKEWIFEIVAEVREMLEKRELPGLIKDHSPFTVLVDPVDHPHRHSTLIHPESWEAA
jgi:hypothetical protein